MSGNGSATAGVAIFLAIAFGPALLLGLVMRLPSVVNRVAEMYRRRRPPAPGAAGPPLERLVADLRRLDRMRRDAPAPTRVRRVALLAAYDEVLLATCRAAGLPDPPLRAWVRAGGTAGALDAGRDLARLRTEAELEATGIRIDPPGPAVV